MPLNFDYGMVIGTLITSKGDSSDEDKLPDVVGATEVKPVFTRLQGQYVTTSPNRMVKHEKIPCGVMADGQLTGDVDSAGNVLPDATPGIWLVVGRYKVTFGGAFPDQWADVTSAHTQENPLDLALNAEYVPPPGGMTQTMLVPSGAATGQLLGMTDDGLGWFAVGSGGGVTDHGVLTGLGDDDHPHYLNAVRGDARYAQSAHLHDDRYFTETESDARFVRTVNSIGPDANGNVTVEGGTGGGGVSDHGALNGLADDDHQQYALADGTRGAFAPVIHDHPSTDVTGLAAVATSGAYADLSGTPTIPDSPDDIGAAAAAHTHDYVASTTVNGLWKGTQAAYDALGSYDPDTLYFILDA